jgi:hypothetical protein
MRRVKQGRPSPALIVAVIALVAALAGPAIGLPGKNNVDKNDLKKNVVKSKSIKPNAVKSKHVKDGQIGIAELTPDEPFHKVGAPGEPAFANGGDNDCIWSNPPAVPEASLNPAAFYSDKNGRVHLAGIVESNNGPGGDGTCDDSNEPEDTRVFTLPPAYRPENLEFFSFGTTAVLVVGDENAVLFGGSDPVEAGSVLITAGPPGEISFGLLDGISFRAAGSGDNGLTPASATAAGSSQSVLERLEASLGS